MADIDPSEEYLKRLFGDDGKQPVDVDGESVELSLPPWFDAELFRRSQNFYKKYMMSMFSGMLTGLISLLAVPTIMKVLLCTRQSGTPMDAYQRYVKTIYHVIVWNETELKPGSESWQSLEMVRRKHLTTRKWCEKAARLTITQRDMALTQFGFMGYVILRPQMLGIHSEFNDFSEAKIHFWRVLGYLLGIKDELNLCTNSRHTTYGRLKIIQDRVFKRALENSGGDFDNMTKSLVYGLWHYNYHLNLEATVFITKRLAGCANYEYFDSDFQRQPSLEDRQKMKYNELSTFQKWKVFIFIYVHETAYKYELVRWIINFQIYLNRLLSYYLPFLAIYFFGIRKAYVRIFNLDKNDRIVRDG